MKTRRQKGESRIEYLRRKYPTLTIPEFTLRYWKILWCSDDQRWRSVADEYWDKVVKDPDRILESLAVEVDKWLKKRGLENIKFRTKNQIATVALVVLPKKVYKEAIRPKNWKERFPRIFRKSRLTLTLNNLSIENKGLGKGEILAEIEICYYYQLESCYGYGSTFSFLNDRDYNDPKEREIAVKYLEQLFLLFPNVSFDWTDIFEYPRFIRNVFIEYGRVYVKPNTYSFIRQSWDTDFKYYLPIWLLKKIFKNQIATARNCQARALVKFIDSMDPRFTTLYEKTSRQDKLHLFLKHAGLTSPIGRNIKIQKLFPNNDDYINVGLTHSIKRATLQVKYNGIVPGKNWHDSGILSDLRKMNARLVKAKELNNFEEFEVLENIFERSTKKRKKKAYDMLTYTVKEVFNFFYLYPRTEADFKLLQKYSIPVLGRFTKYLPPTPENVELIDETTRELLGIQKIISARMKESITSTLYYKGKDTENIIVPFVGDTSNPIGITSFLLQVFSPPSPINIINLIYSGQGLINGTLPDWINSIYFEVTEDWKVTKIARHLQSPGPEVKWIVGFLPSRNFQEIYFFNQEVFGNPGIQPWKICEKEYQNQLVTCRGPFVVYSLKDNKLYFPKYGNLEIDRDMSKGNSIFTPGPVDTTTFPDVNMGNQRMLSRQICYYVEKLKNEPRTFDNWLYEMSRTDQSKTGMAFKS